MSRGDISNGDVGVGSLPIEGKVSAKQTDEVVAERSPPCKGRRTALAVEGLSVTHSNPVLPSRHASVCGARNALLAVRVAAFRPRHQPFCSLYRPLDALANGYHRLRVDAQPVKAGLPTTMSSAGTKRKSQRKKPPCWVAFSLAAPVRLELTTS